MRRALLAVLLLAACGDDGSRPPEFPDAMADAWPCALPAPVCRDPSTLTTCDLTSAQSIDVDCATSGGLCGVGDDGRAACVAFGEPCGEPDRATACTGPVLQACDLDGDTRIVTDCRDHFGGCAVDPWFGHSCTSACTDAGVDANGGCDTAGRVVRCTFSDGAYQVATEVCEPGFRCQVTDSGGAACVPRMTCDAGRTGRCVGDVAERCDGSTLVSEDCAARGDVCVSTLDAVHCAPPGVAGARVVRGTVRYEDRTPSSRGLGAPTPVPAPLVTVAIVVDATGAAVATGATAADGTFTLRHDAAPGVAVHALAISAVPAGPRVIRPDGLLFGVASTSTTDADATLDLLALDTTGDAPAFNTVDVLRRGLDLALAAFGSTTPVDAIYARGSEAGTYYNGALHLLGNPIDDDGHDDAVIAHELGHHIEAVHARTDNSGGPHDGTPTDPRIAWSEGFATWFAVAALGTSAYVDTNAFGGFSVDADTPVTAHTPEDGEFVSEDLVTESLFDLTDAGATDDDPYAGPGAAATLGAIGTWLRDEAHDRGPIGVELTDALDGWNAVHAACAAIRAIVIDARDFAYDACP